MAVADSCIAGVFNVEGDSAVLCGALLDAAFLGREDLKGCSTYPVSGASSKAHCSSFLDYKALIGLLDFTRCEGSFCGYQLEASVSCRG